MQNCEIIFDDFHTSSRYTSTSRTDGQTDRRLAVAIPRSVVKIMTQHDNSFFSLSVILFIAPSPTCSIRHMECELLTAARACAMKINC